MPSVTARFMPKSSACSAIRKLPLSLWGATTTMIRMVPVVPGG